jgi:hypothetical protein
VFPAAASVFEWVQAVAGAVAALAALGTLVFLWLTVREATALRRAETRAHLLELAADYAETGIRVFTDSAAWSDARIARDRFRAAVDSTGEPLPACRALLEVEWRPVGIGADTRGSAPTASERRSASRTPATWRRR